MYHFVLQIKRILAPIPRDKEGKIKIKDFISLDIHSEDAFDVRLRFISSIYSKIVIGKCYYYVIIDNLICYNYF